MHHKGNEENKFSSVPFSFYAMPKKQNSFNDAFDNAFGDADFFDDEFYTGEFDDSVVWNEAEILDICGSTNASKGLALYQNKRVTNTSFDGTILSATVRDDAGEWQVGFNAEDGGGKCFCPTQRKARNLHCEHIAAMLYAFLHESDRFQPQTLGDIIKLAQSDPSLRAKIQAQNPEFVQFMKQLESAPPQVREAFERLGPNASPDQIAQLQDMMQSAEKTIAENELRALLDDQSQNQLRAIAQRRGWTISQNKNEMVTQLLENLRAAPAPDAFTPEEEQLLRLENTLFGLEDAPTAQSLNDLWKRRAGGDMTRLDKARRGLESAGMLFECRSEAGQLHYHWSPLLSSDALPHLRPKIVSLVSAPDARWQIESNAEYLLEQINTLLDLLAQNPLPAHSPLRDPQIAQHPYFGAWAHDAQDVQKFTQPRYVNQSITQGIHIPAPAVIRDETLDGLTTSLSLSNAEPSARLYALWLAAMLNTAGLADLEPERLVLHARRAQEWHTFAPDAQLRSLWNTWRAGGTFELVWLEKFAHIQLQRAPFFAAQFTPHELNQEIGRARRFVVRLLAMLEPQMWYEWDTFAQYVQNLRPDFLHTAFNETHFWLATRDYFKYTAHNASHWDTAYRAFLAAMFQCALLWFGAIEIAYDAGKFVAFQITPLGAWLLRNEPAELFPAPSPIPFDRNEPLVTWLDEKTFRVRGGAESANVLGAARLIAEPTNARLTFQFSTRALARSFERESTPDSIAQKFSDAGAPLPDAMRTILNALYDNYGRVHLYEQLTIMELADDFIVRELLASTSLRQHILHQFSPRVVVIRDEQVEMFVQELEKKGYTPRVME